MISLRPHTGLPRAISSPYSTSSFSYRPFWIDPISWLQRLRRSYSPWKLAWWTASNGEVSVSTSPAACSPPWSRCPGLQGEGLIQYTLRPSVHTLRGFFPQCHCVISEALGGRLHEDLGASVSLLDASESAVLGRLEPSANLLELDCCSTNYLH